MLVFDGEIIEPPVFLQLIIDIIKLCSFELILLCLLEFSLIVFQEIAHCLSSLADFSHLCVWSDCKSFLHFYNVFQL